MRIAYIVSLFPKISETFILREMQAMAARGARIQVVSLKRKGEEFVHPEALQFTAGTIHAGGPLRALGALGRQAFRRPITLLGILYRVVVAHLAHPILMLKSLPLVATGAEVAERLAGAKVDRVHAHWATYPAQVAWIVRLLAGIPYSITAHAHDIFLPNPLLTEKIRSASFVATISRFNRRYLEERCGSDLASRIHVVHCGLPLPEYPYAEPGGDDTPRLVSIGRFVDYKGFPVLLRALAALRREGRPLSCDIVGDGPLRPEIEEAIRELGLEGTVRLLGQRTQEEVREILRGATACVLACQRGHDGQMDGIPVVLMEAMALGVPCVSTRISGIPEILEDGRTGYLADPGDAESLAAGVRRLLEDPVEAREVSRAARRRIEEGFDISRCADDLLARMRESGAR